MNPNSTAAKPAKSIPSIIEEIDHLTAECREVIHSNLVKVTVVVQGRKGIEAVNKVFSFPPGAIPNALKDFFTSWANEMAQQKMILQSETVLLLVGSSQIVALDDFITDYTAGEIPSMSADDAAALKALQQKQIITIKINDCPLQVQRIS